MATLRLSGQTYRRIGAVLGRSTFTVRSQLDPLVLQRHKQAALAWYYRKHYECRASQNLYHLEHKEERNKRNALWRRANPERSRDSCREWRRLNPDYSKLYYWANRESILVRRSERHKERRRNGDN